MNYIWREDWCKICDILPNNIKAGISDASDLTPQQSIIHRF